MGENVKVSTDGVYRDFRISIFHFIASSRRLPLQNAVMQNCKSSKVHKALIAHPELHLTAGMLTAHSSLIVNVPSPRSFPACHKWQLMDSSSRCAAAILSRDEHGGIT